MDDRTRLLPYSSLALVGLGFILPALALPEARRLLLAIGAGAMAILASYPLIARFLRLPLDPLLYALTAALTGLGLAQLSRLQWAGLGPVGLRQLLWLLPALTAHAAGSVLGRSYQNFSHYRYLILTAALILLGLTIPFGVEAGGARAWLDFGGINLQPSEIARPLLLFFLASYLGQHQPLFRAERQSLPLWRRQWLWGPVLAVWFISLVFLLLQRDLGTAVLYYSALLALLYLTSGRLSYVLGGLGLGALGGAAAFFLAGHVKTRIMIWLHPMAYADGAGFQISRSFFAFAAGGLLGTGPGRGLPQATPAVHTDLIFSVIGEELGLAGAMGLLLLYFLLVARGFVLAAGSRDRLGCIYGSGLVFTMGLQTVLIIGGTIGLLPLTGVTLPLMSYGGSSLVSTYFTLGILNGLGSARGKSGVH